MDFSPNSVKSPMVVDLYTPNDNMRQYQEITPDNPAKPVTRSLHAEKKAATPGFSQKLSKRKLFGQPVDQLSDINESVFEAVNKRRKSDDAVKDHIMDCTATVKRPLTERQQLAFLLGATSTRENAENENEATNTFTRIQSRKSIKRNGKCVNPRVYRRNERGETPLHIAAIKGDVAALKKLMKDGAEVSVKDYAGWTALHEACNHGNLEAAKLLVKHGAVVNVLGFEDDTPLHDAVVNNHVEVVSMLLSCGANPHQTNASKKRPTELIGSKEMSDVFKSHGIPHAAFQKKESCAENDKLVSSGIEKASPDDKRCIKTSILGNDIQPRIQRKETQGESKMEKPVMYICKLEPRNEELTIRTTQVTSCAKLEDCGSFDTRDVTCQLVVGVKQDERQETVEKEVLDEEDGIQPLSEVESLAAHHEVKELSTPLQVESSDMAEVHTRGELWPTPASEDSKPAAQGTEIFENRQTFTTSDPMGETKANPAWNSFENIANSSLESETDETKVSSLGNPERDSSSFSLGNEDLSTEKISGENSHQAYGERSRTPEIDESIAVEVLSTGLLSAVPGLSQYYAASAGQQDTRDPCSQGVSLSYPQMTRDVHHIEQGSSQSSVPNEAIIVDVESEDPDLKENLLMAELQKRLRREDGSLEKEAMSSFFDDEIGKKFSSENNTLTTARQRVNGKATIPEASFGLSESNLSNVRQWKVDGSEKKALKVRKRSEKCPGIWNATVEEKVGKNGKDATKQHASKSQDDRTTTQTASSGLPAVTQAHSLDSRALGVNTVKPPKPAVSWQSLIAAGRCQLTELNIPGYDAFLLKTKDYELARDATQEKSLEEPNSSTLTDEKRLSLKHEKSKGELLKKQRSEKDKLQLCMEQEIVRFYAKKAYTSLNRNSPPGVCSAITWQNMSSQQLQNVKKNLTQKLHLDKEKTLPSDHREIIEKYEKLKNLMATRHKHERQSLHAVIKCELESCV